MPLENPYKQMNSNPSEQSQRGTIKDINQRIVHLPRSLSALETWGFGLSGLLLWLGTAPGMQAALGQNAIFVWLPGVVAGILLNLQVQRLGRHLPEMSGGTPNYATHLLKNYPGLTRYGAIGYWLGWVSVPSINAIILTDIIKANFEPLGITCPEMLLEIGFTGLPFIMAFSGTRTLGILHAFFVIPAIGFLLAFCIQGIGWLSLSPASPGLFSTSWSGFSFTEWAKWYFIAIYAVYGCETASSFVADSRRPTVTLKSLSFAASLIPLVYLGGSWVLLRLDTQPGLADNAFLHLSAAASPFWGQAASFLVTFLIASGCLLSSATAVSNSPRILYQLSLDGYLSSVFAVFSRRGVLEPGLLLTLFLSVLCLSWGDVTRVVMVTGTGYLTSMMVMHLGLWLRRGHPEVLAGWWAGGFLLIEAVVLVVGGLAWSWQDWLIGLLLPIGILTADALLRRIAFPPFHPRWWLNRYQLRSYKRDQDFVQLQVGILLLLVCGAASLGWAVRDWIDLGLRVGTFNSNLFVLLLLTVAFVGVAIACWTTLPQVSSIMEAREDAEHLFIIAQDAILVLDQAGVIRQANPAAERLFGIAINQLMGRHLNNFLSELSEEPSFWQNRSEQTLSQAGDSAKTIEVTISDRSHRDLQEYVIILRDITDRKQAEAELQQALQQQAAMTTTATTQTQQLEQTLQKLQQTQAQLIQTEKMSSLGQLVAGVAHEINNPVNFIYGNLIHTEEYMQDLLGLIDLYQQRDENADPEIEERIEEIDFNFLVQDLPKMLSSMKIGADRIRQIVLTLRNFSRLDEAEMKPVNIHEGIDSTLMILHNRLKAKSDRPGIEVIKEYGELPEVECYAGQLNQVFMNLLSNAIDALHQHDQLQTPEAMKSEPSTITIRTQCLDRKWVSITIQDNGPGMSESVKSRLFDPFFTTKQVGEGTGLGLSISYQIVVDKHGGQLRCISAPAKGAEFHIQIPIRQRSQPQLRAVSSSQQQVS